MTDEPRAAGGPAPAGEPDVPARAPAPEAAAAGKGGPAAGAGSGTPSAGKGGPAAGAGSGTPSEGAGSGRPSGSGEGTVAASGEGGEGAPDREDRPDASATGDAAADRPAGDAADLAGASGDPGDGATDDIEVDADLQAAADALEVDLELLLSERAQYLDAYRRAQADFENYRKQAQRRQDDAVVRALGGFVERLLPVLDSCDAALAHGASEVEPVLTALYGALSKEGLERIDPKGAPFDPIEAEAVVHEPGEGGDHVVAEVLRPGYRWRGKVLRPAMVKVTD
ncbi:MAG TPA: nucleotide exchange factor GrpE [Acidimicrobiales bacterium]|nr:nucleotide exchange factor GrpE [Acidimicrobiales bacterium]